MGVPVLDRARAAAAGGRRGQPARPGPLTPAAGGTAISADQHYYTPQPAAAHRPGTVHVVLPDLHLELDTDAGVFSAGRLDPGTRLLLDTVPPPPQAGNLLDLGAGYGPLALVMAARSPRAIVWAVDVNERALGLCAGNAARAGLGNVRCAAPGDPALPATVDAIWSNPPLRIGKQALHALLETWLGRLAPGGLAHLVVARNLGADSLHRWLAAAGWPVTRVAARSGYRVLRAGPPPQAAGAASEEPGTGSSPTSKS